MATCILDLEAVTLPFWQPPPDDPTRFAPAPAWQIIVACVLVVEDGRAPAMHTLDGDERAILEGLRDLLAPATQIVTKGGRRYDLPVIMCRSLALGVEQGWYYAGRSGALQDPRYRYAGTSARHLDLADQLSDYGAGNAGSLGTVAAACGFGGKGDVCGSDVAGLHAAGELRRIALYCAHDVLLTAGIWGRWERLTGAATEERTAKRESWIRERLAENEEAARG